MTAAELAQLPEETRLSLLEQQMRTLLGNGQPGVVQELSAKIDKLSDRLGKVVAVVALLAGGSGIGIGALLG